MKIALSGKKGSGKSTVADYLSDVYGMDVFSFAAGLKSDLINMGVPTKVMTTKPWPEWLRKLAQLYGVSKRETDEYYWIRRMLDDIADADSEGVVVDDLRFWNEAEVLRDEGYVLVRITMTGQNSTDDHISEVDLDSWEDWDHEICADEGDLVDLFDQIDNIIKEEG